MGCINHKAQTKPAKQFFFLKKLFVKIKSRKGHHQAIILKYDISYLTDKEIKDLKFSLKKIIKANKEANREGKTQG